MDTIVLYAVLGRIGEEPTHRRVSTRAILFLSFVLHVVSASRAGTNVWTACGPSTARITSIVIDHSAPAVVYAATDGGGVYKSKDGGMKWLTASKGLTTGYVHKLAIDPSNPEIVYVAGMYSGIYKSLNGGESWTEMEMGLTTAVNTFLIHPFRGSTLYAGTDDGIFMSADGGSSWSSVSSGLGEADNRKVMSLAMARSRPDVIFAGTFGGALYRTNDAGANWFAPNPRAFRAGEIISELAVDPLHPAVVFAGLGNMTVYPLYKSTDGGRSWKTCAADQDLPPCAALEIDPTNPRVIWVGTYGAGVIKSSNSGATWTKSGEGDPLVAHSQVHAIAIDPTRSDTIYAGTDAGVAWSIDGGLEWILRNRGLSNADVFVIAVDHMQPTTIYCGTDGGGLYKTTDAGKSWKPANTGLTDNSIRDLAVDPSSSENVYAIVNSKLFKSHDGGRTWVAVRTLGGDGDRVSRVEIDPLDSLVLYVSTTDLFVTRASLYKSVDGGSTWKRIKHGPGGEYVQDIAISRSDHRTVYLATQRAGIHRSRDGGDTWRKVYDGQQWWANDLTVDPFNPNVLYAGIDSDHSGVLKSVDGGKRWAETALYGFHYVRALASDPKDPRTLYAADSWEGRVYKTADGGSTWADTRLVLGKFSWVTCLAVEPQTGGTVYAGTWGAGVHSITFSQAGNP